MSAQAAETGMRPYQGERREHYEVERRDSGPSLGLILGLGAVVGLGFLAWYYFGPDFVRYMKIRDM
jgi:hypothetical protein